jgi:hypothetical protein
MNSHQKNTQSLVISYLVLRRAIGVVGIALPFIIVLGALIFFQTGLQRSISSYYYTGMRDVLVGILFAVGMFLYSYKGYEDKDDWAGHVACGAAIGAALFPTTPDGAVTNLARIVGYAHLFFTIVFFVTLIYFSLYLFVKSDQQPPYLPKKRYRNTIYRVCGWIMIICMVGIVAVFFVPNAAVWLGGNPIFYFETLAIWAFGVAWFIKGEAIALLND